MNSPTEPDEDNAFQSPEGFWTQPMNAVADMFNQTLTEDEVYDFVDADPNQSHDSEPQEDSVPSVDPEPPVIIKELLSLRKTKI